MNKQLWFAVIAFLFLNVTLASAQCGMYTYHNVLFDAAGNAIGQNVTQGDSCAGVASHANVHITMPSGAQSNGSGNGTYVAEALAPNTTQFETGWGFIEGDNSANFKCWEGVYFVFPPEPFPVPSLSCTSATRGGTVSCTVAPSSGVTVSGWKFQDARGNIVTRTTDVGNLSWVGQVVTSGTVQVVAAVSGITGSLPLSASVTVSNRSNFAFQTVNPQQLNGTNSITCYAGDTHNLNSPPADNQEEGHACADLAYSFNFATINDGGPNKGYEYVTSASDQSGSFPTKFEYIVLSDLLTATTFYNAQCGNFSSSQLAGFIAGSQLKLNVFNHEQGSVFSHWTEYRDAQNNVNNNIGTVLESATAPPGSSGNSFAQTLGDAALSRIAHAVEVEPCAGSVNNNSSQACAFCGAINFRPYQSCNGQPVPHCQ